MQKTRNLFFTKFLWGLMALYILNCSVDAPDAYAEYLPDHIVLNDQDSIVELIIEKLLGFEDAVGEYDVDSEQEYSGKKNFAVDFFIIPSFCIINQPLLPHTNKASGNAAGFHVIPYFEIHSPPPEV